MPGGRISGYEGKLDTFFDELLLAFILRQARSEKLLMREEAAKIAAFIDDFLAKIAMHGVVTAGRLNRVYKALPELFGRVSSTLGFDLSATKTIRSFVKVLYLKRCFYHCNKLKRGMQTLARMHRGSSR